MKCIFVYNPNSGKGKLKNKIDYIKNELSKKFDVVDIHSTVSQEDTLETARKACGVYDALIFSGGDGTFNDIACGIAKEENRPILGYIPSGTVNDIARNLKIPKNLKKALKVITDGNYCYHDVGLINDRYFMYVACVGTFAAVSYRTKQKSKKVFGKLAYVFDGISDFVNPTLVDVKITDEDGKVYQGKTPLFLIVNSISVGGIPFNKNGHLNDGKFDIVIVKKYIGRGIIAIAKTLLIGIRRKTITKYYHLIRSGSFKIEVNDDIIWTLDGEKGMQGPVEIKNLHNHLRIFVPFNKKDRPASKHLGMEE